MTNGKVDNSLGIIGLVVGLLGLFLSMIPCAGVFGFIPAIIGLILGLVAFTKAKDNGDPKTISYIALASSILAIAISVYWFVTMKNFADDITTHSESHITSTNCDSIKMEIKKGEALIAEFEEKIENGEDTGIIGKIATMSKTVIRVEKLNERAIELDCFEAELSPEDSTRIDESMEE